jgi:hypothetical protein
MTTTTERGEKGDGKAGLRALMERVLRTVDEERLRAWSGRGVDEFLRDLEELRGAVCHIE